MISLRINEIPASDSGKGYARLSEQNMREIGVSAWDLIEIGGKRKTVVRAVPFEEIDLYDEDESIIEIDFVTRENAKADIDDYVVVKKANSKIGSRVILCPRNQELLYNRQDCKQLTNRLEGLALTVGDKVSVNFNGLKNEDFDVLSATPSNSVIVNTKTKLDIRKRPHGKIDPSKINFEDVGGLSEQINKIREMVELPFKYPQIIEKLGISPPRGVLLIGPPGSGKTLLAKAVAYETNANFQVVNGPEIMHKYYGESEAKIRDVFDVATKNQPSIIFLDELDAIAPKREKVAGDVEKRVVAQLLTLMDGLKDRGNVVVIGASNLPDSIDPALRRPGRFDREVRLEVPDINGRKEILEIHTREMPLSEDVDLERLSELTHGFVGADLENLSREAAMSALSKVLSDINEDDDINEIEKISPLTINMNDFVEALKGIEPSAIREIFVEIPQVNWDDVGGLEEIKDRLTETVIWPLKYNNLYEASNTRVPRGILLTGKPGTGKTLLAKALANQSGVNFISVKGAELLSKYVGESEKSIREVFKKAKQVSPSIIFFDEIDALAPIRTDENLNKVSERVVSQLLTEMDGVEELTDVTILAATNRLDMVDPALLRSGRFDSILEIPLPAKGEIVKILKIHTREKPLSSSVSFENLSKQMKGFSGADIELVCNRASMLAIKEHITHSKKNFKITQKHLQQSIDEIKNHNKLSN